jgi:hypothetical protein
MLKYFYQTVCLYSIGSQSQHDIRPLIGAIPLCFAVIQQLVQSINTTYIGNQIQNSAVRNQIKKFGCW